MLAARRIRPFILPPSPELADALDETWPGPVTWLMPARPGVPAWITGGRDTIAVRVTAHAQCRALCLATGTALVSTSANISGRAPARSSTAVRLQFGDALDYLVPGRLGGLAGPSEIRDGRNGGVVRAATP